MWKLKEISEKKIKKHEASKEALNLIGGIPVLFTLLLLLVNFSYSTIVHLGRFIHTLGPDLPNLTESPPLMKFESRPLPSYSDMLSLVSLLAYAAIYLFSLLSCPTFSPLHNVMNYVFKWIFCFWWWKYF